MKPWTTVPWGIRRVFLELVVILCLWASPVLVKAWSWNELLVMHKAPAPSYRNGLAALHLEPIQAAPPPASHLARRTPGGEQRGKTLS